VGGWVGLCVEGVVCVYVYVFVSACACVCVQTHIDTHTRILKCQFAAQFTVEHDCRADL